MAQNVSYGPMRGGLWNTTRPTFSNQTQKLLKEMMQESKLTSFQQRTINDRLSNGRSLPPRVAPTFTIVEKRRAPPKQQEKIVDPRKYKNGLRDINTIIESGAYETSDYKPRPKKAMTDKDKNRLSNIMAYGRDIETNPFTTQDDSTPEPVIEIDRFDEIRMEIEERNQFLQDMAALGKTREYKPIIMAEISQKIREMELIDKDRTEELKRLIAEQQ